MLSVMVEYIEEAVHPDPALEGVRQLALLVIQEIGNLPCRFFSTTSDLSVIGQAPAKSLIASTCKL